MASPYQVDELESLSTVHHQDIYPGIDPEHHFLQQSYADKVVLVTGASRGIGKEIAIHYARAGGIMALMARDKAALDDVSMEILSLSPASKIATYSVDVSDPESVKAAVSSTVEKFGKLDIVVANAGISENLLQPFTDYDPSLWWRTMEVNLRGTYNVAHSTLSHLSKTSGYFVAVSSIGAYSKLPFCSSYCISKLGINFFVEFISIEHPNVKAFAFHPGAVLTSISLSGFEKYYPDSVRLPAATMLRLTSGKEDWLSGRFVSANWDFDEIDQLKENILKEDALVSRLHGLSKN